MPDPSEQMACLRPKRVDAYSCRGMVGQNLDQSPLSERRGHQRPRHLGDAQSFYRRIHDRRSIPDLVSWTDRQAHGVATILQPRARGLLAFKAERPRADDQERALDLAATMTWLKVTLEDLPDAAPASLRPVLTSVLSVVLATIVERPEERIAIGGTANLTRHALDFPMTLRPVLEALEEQVVLLKLMGEVNDPTTVHVKIGEENNVEGLRSTSVVTVGYGPDAGSYGGLGVVGPTRMDYAGNIGHVRAVARYVGELLAGA